MRVMECPRCHRQVGILDDGLCPQCGQNVGDPAGIDASRGSLTIHAGASLPNLCTECGGVAMRHKRLTATQSEEERVEKLPYGCFIEALGKLGLIIKIFMKSQETFQHFHQTLRLDLPRCDGCAGKDPVLVSTMLDRGAVTIVVHRRFGAEYRKLNAPR